MGLWLPHALPRDFRRRATDAVHPLRPVGEVREPFLDRFAAASNSVLPDKRSLSAGCSAPWNPTEMDSYLALADGDPIAARASTRTGPRPFAGATHEPCHSRARCSDCRQ